MPGKTCCLLLFLFICSALPSWIHAGDQTVFGPRSFEIGKWHIHTSVHMFNVEDPGEGIVTVTKNTPDQPISGGFILFNTTLVPLRDFLTGDEVVFEKQIILRSINVITVFLRGTSGASVSIEVEKAAGPVPPPVVTLSADPQAIELGQSSTLSWSSTHADTCEIDQGVGSVSVNGSASVSPTQTTTYTITATGPGGTSTADVTITVDDVSPPRVSISADPLSITPGQSTTLTWTSINAQNAHIDNGIGAVSVNGSIAVSPTATTTYTITVTGPTGSASAQAVVRVTGNPAPLPEGSFGKQYEDLIPTDATVDEYDAKRFSVITGRVRSIDDSPVSDVSVTLHSHPEYGTVLTDAEGRFSIPVEGGTTLTLVYNKAGFISAQRKVYVPWNDIAIAETIRMIAQDPLATTITFDGSPDTVVTHQSTKVTDEFGSRSCSMVFTGDNHAYLVDENGNDVHELTTITTRATEFTTPESMPAVLPPTSAYTYCAELSVDGAQRVRFEKPVITWVDNFLGFDVGMIVPFGYYDRDKGFWIPSDNGIVVKLLDTDTDGVVDALDADGDGQPDDLNSDGSFNDEVQGLDNAGEYPPDSTFWRVAVTHFTPGDWNWPFRYPEDAIDPNPENEPNDEQWETFEPCLTGGASSVEDRSRIFHEDIPIPGTKIALHYTSNRVQGCKNVISIPVSGPVVPASLKRILVKVEVAGRTLEQTLDPEPNRIVEFNWDGIDYLGRHVSFTQGRVSIGFVYNTEYLVPGDYLKAFGQTGKDSTWISTRREMTLWKKNNIFVGNMAKKAGVIAEGWSLTPHHYLNPIDPSRLYKGDGTISTDVGVIIDTVAGNGTDGYSGDGGPATQAQLNYPDGVVVDTEGSLYIADKYNYRVRKVDAGGTITTIAGDGTQSYNCYGDGNSATRISLVAPLHLQIDALGNLYIDSGCCLLKVDKSGMTSVILEDECFPPIEDIAVDRAGNIYFPSDRRIDKMDTSGNIAAVAGNGTYGYSGDGGHPILAQLTDIEIVDVDTSGNLYITDSSYHVIRKVGPVSGLPDFSIGGDIPFAEKNGLGHIMSSTGLHKNTFDLDTGVMLREFGYDENKKLISMTDRSGNRTTIERDGNGVPISMTSPDGLTTTFIIDATNHLSRITYPDGSYYRFEYTPDGLLTAKMDPEGNRFEHVFDSNGKLTDATDEQGGHWQFSKTAYANGDILSEVLTGEGNLTSYLDRTCSTGAFDSTIIGPTGAQTLFARSNDGLTVNKTLPCGTDLEFKYDLDSEYKFRYIKEMMETTPSGLERITLREKDYQDTDSDYIPDLITETVTVNGKSTTLENNVFQSQKTITSPEGRTVTTLYDPSTLLTESVSVPGLFDTTYGYDTRGRLTSIDTNTRGTDFTYNTQGFLESITAKSHIFWPGILHYLNRFEKNVSKPEKEL